MKKPQFPLRVSEQGVLAKVRRIVQNKYGEAYVFYVVEYVLLGKRKQEWFSELEAAKTAASDACRKIANGEQSVLQLKNQDRLVYLRALDLLKPTGLELDMAVSDFAQAFTALNGKGTLLEAAREFAARHSIVLPKISVPDAVELLKKQVEADGKSEVRQQDYSSVLDRFAKSFNVEVAALTPKLISDYLVALPFQERTKRNHRDVIKIFSRWLVLRGYLAKGTDLLEGVQNYSARKIGEITTFTPEEMTSLLQNASERILPFLVIGGFAGLRHAEISRLDWQDIDLQEGFIEVRAENAKTDTRRIVPIKENLKAWLLTMAKKSGPVVGLANIANPLSKLAQKAGVKWKHNALRHTYISARVAECADVPRVADEAGNSPTIIRTNYLKRMRPAFAAAWFNIMPGISLAIPLPAAETAKRSQLAEVAHLSSDDTCLNQTP